MVISCNRAHYYYNQVRAAVDFPILNMIDVTVETITEENPLSLTLLGCRLKALLKQLRKEFL